MKILILGAEGFIGKNLSNYFALKKFDVYGCDIVDTNASLFTAFHVKKTGLQWDHIFSSQKFDHCINAAGSGNVNYSVTHPFEDFESNTSQTIQILDAIRKHNASCRYLHISSAAVYGNPGMLPVNETAACNPISPYGWHKLMAEQLCKEYSQLFGLSIAIARPFSIYGPGLKKQIFWDTFQKYNKNNDSIELWGTGNESRDFIFIDDVAEAFHFILEHAAMNGEVYNIASGNETSVSDAVNKLFDHMPSRPMINFNKQVRQGDPLNWRADISRLNELGFYVSTKLEKGIEKLASWFLQNVS